MWEKPSKVVSRKRLASKESEIALLSLCFNSSVALDDIIEKTQASDYDWDEHRFVFEAIQSLYEANIPITVATVGDALNKKGVMESVGGNAFLLNLKEISVSEDECEENINIVKNWGTVRAVKNKSEEMIRQINSEDLPPAASLVDNYSSYFMELGNKTQKGETYSARVLGEEVLQKIELSVSNKRPESIPTGFKTLNIMTTGYYPGNYIVVSGRTSAGKTCFALQSALNVAKEGYPVFIFSLEMTKEDLMFRMVANETRIPFTKIRSGQKLDDTQLKTIRQKIEYLRSLPLYVDETSNLTAMEIRSKIRRLQGITGKVGLVVVDYIGLVQGKDNYGSDTGYNSVGSTSLDLKNTAKDLKIPLMVLAQMNRNCESRTDKTPILSDIADSDRIARDADLVMMLYRPAYYEKKGEFPGGMSNGTQIDDVELMIAKQRNGPTGVVHLNMEMAYSRMFEG